MIRAQIYLTEHEKKYLSSCSLETGRSQSELIREAIDAFIKHGMAQGKNARALLSLSEGMWKDREGLLDMSKLRSEFDRDF